MASDDEAIDDLPRGVVSRKRRRWQGEEMEMEHQLDSSRRDDKAKAKFAAVDTSQFHNSVVGEGYKAKHVVRQATVPKSTPQMKVRDMTGGAQFDSEKASAAVGQETTTKIDIETLLKNDGLRAFRKEIENLLN